MRFGYFLMKDNPKATGGPFAVLKPVLQQVTPTGAFDNALAAAIRTHQSLRGAPRIAEVSVAKDNQFNRGQYDGKHVWMAFR